MNYETTVLAWLDGLTEYDALQFRCSSPAQVYLMAWGASGLANIGIGDFTDALHRLGIRPRQVKSAPESIGRGNKPQFELRLRPDLHRVFDHA